MGRRAASIGRVMTVYLYSILTEPASKAISTRAISTLATRRAGARLHAAAAAVVADAIRSGHGHGRAVRIATRVILERTGR